MEAKKENLTGLILARGGSKEIPLKNLVSVGGIPLLTRSIRAMKEFGQFDSIWVSTDHPDLTSCAQEEGAKVFSRSAQNAKDNSKSIDAVQEFIECHQGVQTLCLVQCTSPFLQPKFLHSGYELISRGYDSVFSGTRDKKFRWSVVDCGLGETTRPINLKPDHRTSRQNRQGEIVENGMFYFTRRKYLAEGLFQGGRVGYVEIPAEYSIEIDTKLDLLIAEQICQSSFKL